MKTLFISLFLALLLLGCDLTGGSDSSSSSSTTPTEKRYYVSLFTLAPVVNATLKDATNQVALYDAQVHKYYFENNISYPVTATLQANTYIDIDYDGNETANDLKPSRFFQAYPLKSFCSSINLLTSVYYNNALETTTTTSEFQSDVKRRFNIDVCQEPPLSIENAKVLFGAYNYSMKVASAFNLDDIESSVTEVNDFFQLYLANLASDEDKIAYYSSYDALLQLDLGHVTRTDTLHKPQLSSILRAPLTPLANNTNVDVFDILPFGANIYVAAGHDELASMDTSLQNQVFEANVSLESFGNQLYQQSYLGNDCLFLADAKALMLFQIDSNGFSKNSTITKYLNTSDIYEDFAKGLITNSNGYISVNGNKRLLGISTDTNGYYLLNIKETMQNCTLDAAQITSDDFLIAGVPNPTQATHFAVDATFRNDGTYLYVANKADGVTGYKTDTLDATEIANSLKSFTLERTLEAYHLKLFNNDNELLVTTNQGVQIYDVGSAVDTLNFVSEYTTQGAELDYFQDIDTYDNFVFLTDGYQGVKVLKLSNSFEPMLCGVEYFAPKDKPFELAKTTSIKYDNGNLYVGVSSYGIVKFALEDILFEHCK